MKRLFICLLMLTISCKGITKEKKSDVLLVKPDLIFLLGGQSNMAGNGFKADLPDTDEYKTYRTSPKNVSVWNAKSKKWQSLKIGKKFGPEIGFAHALSKALPNKQTYRDRQICGRRHLYEPVVNT